jgi:hypothetical protein
MVEGTRTLDLTDGMLCSAQIDFRANVLRGTYRIGLRLTEQNREWPPIEMPGLSSFIVHETTRVAGCAEVEATYRLSQLSGSPSLSLRR